MCELVCLQCGFHKLGLYQGMLRIGIHTVVLDKYLSYAWLWEASHTLGAEFDSNHKGVRNVTAVYGGFTTCTLHVLEQQK